MRRCTMYARISIKVGPGRNRIVSFAEIDSVKHWFSQQIVDPLHIDILCDDLPSKYARLLHH